MTTELKVTLFDIDKLILDPDNAREHPFRNIDAITRSIKLFGIRKPVVASADTKIVYAGNATVEAALNLGITELPVAWIPEDTPVEICKAYAIADNRSAELAEWNFQQLETTLDDINIELENLGFDEQELEELLAANAQDDDREETFDVTEAMEAEVEPLTQTGDIWLCGKHRVMCGDSTKAEDVERLMNGGKAQGIFTSPPYAEQRQKQYGGIPADKYLEWWELIQATYAITSGRDSKMVSDGAYH
ncbi:MAG: ParB N-terminal domain-containing protein [Planctomycetota bacterium]|jgi:ParB-like chromosome segregation protein Spo0J